MAIINRNRKLPRNRITLYEHAAELLLQQWDTERHLQNYPDLKTEIRFWAKSEILRTVAMEMQTGGKKAANLIHEDKLIALIAKYLEKNFGKELLRDHPSSVAEVLVKQLRERNFILCFLGGDSYGFVHRTFLEYFCATEFVHQFEKKKTLSLEGLLEIYDAHCRDDDWQEVLRLICGQIDEQFAGKIIAHLTDRVDMEVWDRKTPIPVLALAVWCLGEVRHLNRIDEKIGAKLLLKVIDCFFLEKEGGSDNTYGLFIAAKAVGGNWPGKDIFQFNGQCPEQRQRGYSVYIRCQDPDDCIPIF